MTPTHPLHLPAWTLAAFKLGILTLGVVLQYSGHLSGPAAAVLCVVAGAFGVQAWLQALGANASTAQTPLMNLLGPVVAYFAQALQSETPTPASAAPPPPPPPAGGPRPSAVVKAVLPTAGVFALAMGLCGCPQAVATIVPDAVLAECVATNALEGHSVGAIELACQADLAPILSALIGSTDARVQSSRAYAEAKRAQVALGNR